MDEATTGLLARPAEVDRAVVTERLPALVVFSDDWGRHPSSCQHLIGQLLPRYDVLWVNTIGTRPPHFDLLTLRRGGEKVAHWLRGSPKPDRTAQNQPGPAVANPWMWPWFSRPRDRALNRHLLVSQLRRRLRRIGRPVIGITTVPITADVMQHLPVDRWVYYCVDDFSEWPGLDRKTLQDMEREVIQQADVLIAVSETLVQKLRAQGRSAELLTHGVDLEHWRSGTAGTAGLRIGEFERPLVVFWGVIDRRMDLTFLRRLSDDLERGTILLAGPLNDPDPALFEIPRVRQLPPVPFEALPQLGCEAAVLIMPYADLPVTRAIQPLKLKEYLATGRPVVVRDLPATRPWGDYLDLSATAEEFSRQVRRCLNGIARPNEESLQERLQAESWSAKARQFEQWALRLDRKEGTFH